MWPGRLGVVIKGILGIAQGWAGQPLSQVYKFEDKNVQKCSKITFPVTFVQHKYIFLSLHIFLLNQLCKTFLLTKRELSLIFSSLKKFCFFKSVLLVNFLFWRYSYILNLLNILMILNKSIIRFSWVGVTISAQINLFFELQLAHTSETNQTLATKNALYHCGLH